MSTLVMMGFGDKSTLYEEHDFTLVLATDPTEDDAEKLYAAFNDGTISTIAGLASIQFHREANSLEHAIRSAIDDVRRVGIDVARVEMEPDSLLQSA